MRDDTPAGRFAGDGVEPASACYTLTTVRAGLLGRVVAAARAGMARRSAGRADHLHLPSVDVAAGVLGGDLVAELTSVLRGVNARWWRLDVDSFQVKVLRYGHGHHHPEHVDMFPGSMRRKVTMVVQLSDPGGYVGGDLEVVGAGQQWSTVPRQAGLAVVFPSWTRHRVSPVVDGERWSLAVWGYGPPVR